MLRGIEVEVVRPVYGGADGFGEPVRTGEELEAVRGVIVAPSSTSDLADGRRDMARVDATLHFPRGYDRPLAGCEVVLPAPWAGRWRVVGSPVPHMVAQSLVRYDMAVKVVRVDG